MRHLPYPLLTFLLVIFFTANTFAQSPYKTDWKKNSIILAGGVGVAFLASALDNDTTKLTIAELNDLSRDDINSFDQSTTNNYSEDDAHISDIVVATCLAAPLTLFLSEEIREDFGTVGVMYLETLLLATFTPSFGKSLGRIRPYAYNEDAPLDRKMNSDTKSSFWSGHTSWAFSSAVFFATVYSDYYPDSKWKPYVWGGSLLAASAVGYLRYSSGAHFPTDVLVGATVGSAIGYFIPYIYRNRDGSNLSVSPQVGLDRFQLALNYSF
ncbi:MAG: phosphatase PAP2 family protein [Ignavibacteriae bacterium]|nr:phosphatase PAP2 family protein [Ignavibacteriota bacterium]